MIEEKLLIIRADATPQMGTGHVMRCLALAQAWQESGGTVCFAMAECTPALEARLVAEGMALAWLKAMPGSAQDAAQLIALAQEKEAAWLVVDGYQFDNAYQTAVAQAGLRLFWIDDFGDIQPYSADLVLNQNIYGHADLYGQPSPKTRLLMGCAYALLRREFWPYRGWQRENPPQASKILVTLGGSDPHNTTAKIIDGLLQITGRPWQALIVVGGSNPHVPSLQTAVAAHPEHLQLALNITDMPERMAWADIAIAAGGSTSWELALMGLPALMVILADNQERIVQKLAEAGIAVNLGWHHQLEPVQIAEAIANLLANVPVRQHMSQKGQKLVDGWGAERAVRAMQNPLRARRVTREDAERLFAWANDPLTRQMSFHREPIAWSTHWRWFERVLSNPLMTFLIVEWQGDPAGQVRIDGEGVISIGLNPAYRGRKLAQPLLQTAVDYYLALSPPPTPVKTLIAYIKPENIASQTIFCQTGFQFAGQIEQFDEICEKYTFTLEEQPSGAKN